MRNRKQGHSQQYISGIRKWLIYLRIGLEVVLRFFLRAISGKFPIHRYPIFLYRALIFLYAVRHNKIVKLEGLYKIHLYIPAYPSKAFFKTLEKLHSKDPGPVTVVFSMTRACTYSCPHCYQKKDAGKDIDLSILTKVAKQMERLGVTMFDIEGGEPLSRPERLMELLECFDEDSELWINTTGCGLSDDLVEKLVSANLRGVMVSIHSTSPEEFDGFTGFKGAFENATKTLEAFHKAGLFTVINFVPTPDMIRQNGVAKLFDLARELNCSMVQVIHAKASGGWLGNDSNTPGENLIDKLKQMHLEYNSPCKSDYPLISVQVFEEDSTQFGCTAGGIDRFYLGADGEVQPCEFLNISCGNVNDDDFEVIFERMRALFPNPCSDWLCCKWADAIARAVEERSLKRTPIPWEITRELIKNLDRGKPTRLYKKLGIYK